MSDKTKKIIKKISIIGAIAIIIFAGGFCAGRFTRLGRIKSNSNGIEQRIDNTGNAAVNAGTNITSGTDLANSAGTGIDSAIGYGEQSTKYIEQLQSQIDELVGATKTYQESLQFANTTINDLFDYSIRKAELDEQLIESVIRLSESCEQSSTEQ